MYISPDSSFITNPTSLAFVTLPSFIVTGGNASLLIGVSLAHPDYIGISNKKKDRVNFHTVSPVVFVRLTS